MDVGVSPRFLLRTAFERRRKEVQMAELDNVRTVIERVLPPLGLELVDVELVGSGRARTLRVFLEGPAGVDLDVLTAASEPVSVALDAADVPAGPYTLEVSSPGLERPLRRPGDFVRFVGTTVSLKSRDAVSGARRHRGVLVEADDESVVLDVDGEVRHFRYEGITQARTVFEWGHPSKPGHGKGRPKGEGKRNQILAEERSG
jgi:ribosome maturation factor RimP